MIGRARVAAFAAAVTAALLLSGCGESATHDKAGRAEPARTLTLGSPDSEGTPGTDALRHFAAEVDRRSHGRITISLVYNAAGSAEDDVEGAVIRQVRDGELDLGWVGTRAWDGEQVVGFSALQAPFLVNDYGVLDAVMTSDIPHDMLAELDDVDLVGLGLLPDQLRHPLGFRAPFLTVEDFSGATLRVPGSRVSEAVIRALGAEPVNLTGSALGEAVDSGAVVGAETSIGNASTFPIGSYLTTNVTFYPKLQTLFAGSEGYSSLSKPTRSVLEEAAEETLTYLLGQDPERDDIQAFCDLGGKLVTAAPADLAAIVGATEPVIRDLETDATVAAYIEEIEALKSSSTPTPLERCPA